jgi:hypothetical protein
MERIDRSFVDKCRGAQTSKKRGVGALVDAYRYLKTVTLKEREIKALSRFRDPLEAALECWKRKSDRVALDFCAMLAELAHGAERFLTVGVTRRALPRADFSRKQRERMTSARRILYGAMDACPAGN